MMSCEENVPHRAADFECRCLDAHLALSLARPFYPLVYRGNQSGKERGTHGLSREHSGITYRHDWSH